MKRSPALTTRLSTGLATVLMLVALDGCSLYATPTVLGAAEDTDDPYGLWGWCPQPSPTEQPLGDDEMWLQFHPDALYCSNTPPGTWQSEVQLWDELDQRFQLRLVPADLFLPTTPGEYDMEMPVCLRGGNTDVALPAEAGRLVVERQTVLGQERMRYTWERTLRQQSGRALTVRVFIDGFDWALSGGVKLDGSPWPRRADPTVRLHLCEGETCEGEIDPEEDAGPAAEEQRAAAVSWDACRFEEMGTETYRLDFDGGELTLDFENEGDPYTQRNALIKASGDLLGVPFEQLNFWRLGQRASYPQSYSKDIAIVFDAPVGAFCGVTLRELYPGGWLSGGIQLKHCSDEDLDEDRTVFTVDWESTSGDE